MLMLGKHEGIVQERERHCTEIFIVWMTYESYFFSELCGLKSLSILMLSGNYITSLPEAVKGLTGLQGLYIDHNLLKELPRSLAYLPILTRVSCCCNNIAYLPALPFATKPTLV